MTGLLLQIKRCNRECFIMNVMASNASKKYPPGPGGLPIFGSLLSVAKDPHLAIHLQWL